MVHFIERVKFLLAHPILVLREFQSKCSSLTSVTEKYLNSMCSIDCSSGSADVQTRISPSFRDETLEVPMKGHESAVCPSEQNEQSTVISWSCPIMPHFMEHTVF